MRIAVTLPLVAALAAVPAAGQDPHSFSRPDQVAVTHLALDLAVDFEAKRLSGTATLTLDRRDPAATELRLDTRDLEIEEIRVEGAEQPVAIRLAEPVPYLGQGLTIPITPGTGWVKIRYRTRPEAAALQWLEPSQTAGGKRPFLFSQSQAILARTWIPCQDTPGVRATYDATVRVPSDLLAVMSADNPRAKSADGVYRFRMTEAIPSYLLAIAVGDLEFRELGARSGVYAEPSVVGKAAWELADTEKMIEAAEKLYGPYRWGRYDILVLPPSFPFGGMENPRLTFATPTILAGDRSLVALVAHELAHSWSGNLVTNATWNDFWLNEGFTVYFENRIMEAVYGVEYAEMLAALSRRELEAFVAAVGADSRDTWLYGHFDGRDPDEGVGPVAYEKGFLFLKTLEAAAGRARFDAFLRAYFEANAFRTMTTARFVEILGEKLLAGDPSIAAKVPVERWIYGPGIPDGAYAPQPAAFAKVDAELAKLAAGAAPSSLTTTGWVTQQWLHFLGALPADLTKERLTALDAAFGFSRSGNSEIFSAWALRAIPAGYEPVLPELERFLTTVGRRKFLKPIYEALMKTPDGSAWAKRVYAAARPGYHAVSQATIDGIVGAPQG